MVEATAEPMMDADGVVLMTDTKLYERGAFKVVRTMASNGVGAVELWLGGTVVFAADFDERGDVYGLSDGEAVEGTEALREAVRAFMVAL